jgi:hypothetical protein
VMGGAREPAGGLPGTGAAHRAWGWSRPHLGWLPASPPPSMAGGQRASGSYGGGGISPEKWREAAARRSLGKAGTRNEEEGKSLGAGTAEGDRGGSLPLEGAESSELEREGLGSCW